MEYLIGVILALAISFVFGTVVGFDRSRAFYPVVSPCGVSKTGLTRLSGLFSDGLCNPVNPVNPV